MEIAYKMSYFPNILMPLTQKSDNLIGATNPILASDYNKHDNEIRSIEEFLGVINNPVALGTQQNPSILSKPINNVVNSLIINQNLLNNISKLTNKINTFISQGIQYFSGTIYKSGK